MNQQPPFEDLIQIPGPNPILTCGGPGEWDEGCIEAADIFCDHGTYYLFYHARGADAERWPGSYRLGVATASHPLGPWTKHPGNPILELGEAGAWDSQGVACGCLLKEGVDRYYLWYSGLSEEGWSIGLAAATHPLGPWTKHPNNPVLPGFGYVGGVVRVSGEYRLYSEHPIGRTGPDYGPLSMARAPEPEGPWTPHDEPVLVPGDWGAWDDGGYNEAKVLYHEGLYHVFYGGAKLHPTRIRSEESIGYAWSEDGFRFHKHPRNPVALRQHQPNAAAFAEVHALYEPPLVYCYHTLRYRETEGHNLEDIGVQVLATRRPFCVTMPVLTRETLESGDQTFLEDCALVCGENIHRIGLQTAAGDVPVDCWLWGSLDGVRFQPVTVDATASPPAYMKVTVENYHSQPARDLCVRMTLWG